MDNIKCIGDKCTGCGLCRYICPKKCISFKEQNENGHFCYPVIDEKKCVSCGICLSHCPVNNIQMARKEPSNAFLFYSQDKELLEKSTSGGAFGVLASFVLSNHGVVYGASWTNNLTVEHRRIDSIKELPLVQKSKYIQSQISEDIYSQIKKDVLEYKKTVLFSGTPCQCAAVSKLFMDKAPYNLILVDIICHGIPSQWLFNRWKSATEKRKNIKIESFSFRVKKERFGVRNFSYIYTSNKSGMHGMTEGSPIYNLFLKRFYDKSIFRNSCYSCSFRGHRYFSDFTLGDFWNIEKIDNAFLSSNNKSLVIINSTKGKQIFEQVFLNNKLIFKEYPVQICLKNNFAYFNNPTSKLCEKVLKKWEKDWCFTFYDFKTKCNKPYYVLKNFLKKTLKKKSPLIFYHNSGE